MRKIIFTILFLLFGFSISFAQYLLKNQDDVKWYQNLPQEDVYIHHNSNLLLSGESLYYKVYCHNAKTKLLSKNSKIAYVELVGTDGVVFKHRIRLENGIGQGHFFIPVSVKTGNYKLIGYTRWMMNREDAGFYQANISIVNPYAKIEFDNTSSSVELGSKNNSNLIAINTNSDTYTNREPVNLTIEGMDVSSLGNYSISVRRFGDISKEINVSINDQASDKPIRNKPKSVGDTIFLPEFKGEMITGTVTDKTSGYPVNNVDIALSVLSDESIQDIAKTNQKGIFYFQISNNYKTPRALIQVIGDKRKDYILKVDELDYIDYSTLEFPEFKISEKHKQTIIDYSINNQIENAYRNVKQDKNVLPKYPKPFFGNPMTTYMLDDYKRFINIAETLDEVVDHAYHERKGGKTRYINVRERESDPYYDVDILPLVLVDGASIQDHQSLLSFETKDVESISVLRQEYYYGDKVYQGVLLINTFNKDYYKSLNGDYLRVIDLMKPQLTTKYFVQEYSESNKESDRIPDQRIQLLWLPNIELSKKRNQLKFYTPDNPGDYQISVFGFTSDGVPVKANKVFSVE